MPDPGYYLKGIQFTQPAVFVPATATASELPGLFANQSSGKELRQDTDRAFIVPRVELLGLILNAKFNFTTGGTLRSIELIQHYEDAEGAKLGLSTALQGLKATLGPASKTHFAPENAPPNTANVAYRWPCNCTLWYKTGWLRGSYATLQISLTYSRLFSRGVQLMEPFTPLNWLTSKESLYKSIPKQDFTFRSYEVNSLPATIWPGLSGELYLHYTGSFGARILQSVTLIRDVENNPEETFARDAALLTQYLGKPTKEPEEAWTQEADYEWANTCTLRYRQGAVHLLAFCPFQRKAADDFRYYSLAAGLPMGSELIPWHISPGRLRGTLRRAGGAAYAVVKNPGQPNSVTYTFTQAASLWGLPFLPSFHFIHQPKDKNETHGRPWLQTISASPSAEATPELYDEYLAAMLEVFGKPDWHSSYTEEEALSEMALSGDEGAFPLRTCIWQVPRVYTQFVLYLNTDGSYTITLTISNHLPRRVTNGSKMPLKKRLLLAGFIMLLAPFLSAGIVKIIYPDFPRQTIATSSQSATSNIPLFVYTAMAGEDADVALDTMEQYLKGQVFAENFLLFRTSGTMQSGARYTAISGINGTLHALLVQEQGGSRYTYLRDGEIYIIVREENASETKNYKLNDAVGMEYYLSLSPDEPEEAPLYQTMYTACEYWEQAQEITASLAPS